METLTILAVFALGAFAGLGFALVAVEFKRDRAAALAAAREIEQAAAVERELALAVRTSAAQRKARLAAATRGRAARFVSPL